MTALAFDYRGDQCPTGYSLHTYQDIPSQCVWISTVPPYDSDIRDATTAVTLKRKAMLWSGVVAMGVRCCCRNAARRFPVGDCRGWRGTGRLESNEDVRLVKCGRIGTYAETPRL